jgi:hypothetical protein
MSTYFETSSCFPHEARSILSAVLRITYSCSAVTSLATRAELPPQDAWPHHPLHPPCSRSSCGLPDRRA